MIPAVDPNKAASPLVRRLTPFALSKPATWFYSKVAARIDPYLVRATRGKVDTSFGLFPLLLLSVKGAKSGIERTVPLVYFTDGDDVVLMASSFGRPKHPAWYFNLKAAEEVKLEARGRSGRYRPRETEGADRDRLYELAKEIYSGYGVYEERAAGAQRSVPVMRLTPVA